MACRRRASSGRALLRLVGDAGHVQPLGHEIHHHDARGPGSELGKMRQEAETIDPENAPGEGDDDKPGGGARPLE